MKFMGTNTTMLLISFASENEVFETQTVQRDRGEGADSNDAFLLWETRKGGLANVISILSS